MQVKRQSKIFEVLRKRNYEEFYTQQKNIFQNQAELSLSQI